MAILCTDAGHGGSDSGAAWNNILEKDLNLVYTQDLNAELKSRGHTVLTTRKTDSNVPPLRTRCRLINAHHREGHPAFDAIISIHCNVAASWDEAKQTYVAHESVRGFYGIYSRESQQGDQLAAHIAKQCRKADVVLNHEGKLTTLQLGRTLAWIHKTLPPAVLLELGFMTNPDELQLLQESTYRQKMVNAIADGIESFVKQ